MSGSLGGEIVNVVQPPSDQGADRTQAPQCGQRRACASIGWPQLGHGLVWCTIFRATRLAHCSLGRQPRVMPDGVETSNRHRGPSRQTV